ncbi:DNA-binding response OmpR family regulator [Silvibacterium bohemicum]|uniref:DNA-binding response OmpR family regulator n=1 Tax=Silvibacterium bohemicum TaxID=1577686 RepID=A0A841JUI1_9BACT|nr:response regulator transcription factor [Silvibacterium bohemicum]MBB6144117.1 DNA-binding response OmpR family regulator [Silvibacterium bohemicum]
MSKLLIIDDDRALAGLLAERMLAEGFILDAALDGKKGLELANSGSYALVILDIMMPRMGGMEVLKSLRTKSAVPVLMLTAKGDDIDRILGLELGADDYLPKPFNPRELIARIRAILRRVEERGGAPNRIEAEDITIDTQQREAHFQGKQLQLTTVEFALLEVLVRHMGRVLSRDFLTDAAMGRSLGFADRTVDVHISNLRKKLSTNRGVERIKTVRGTGYLLTPRQSAENL